MKENREMVEKCVHSDFCGGCAYQGLSYEEQLDRKDRQVTEALDNKKVRCSNREFIEGCTEHYRYRSKMEYTFGDMEKDGPLTLGMHQKGRFMSVVTVDRCMLADEDFNRILRGVLDFCVAKGYPRYHKKTHRGFLRHLVIRKGHNTEELLINLVTSSQTPEGFSDDEFLGLIMGLGLENDIAGVLHTINDSFSDAVKCDKMNVLYGRDYYTEKILDLDFRVSAFSFFQTNVEAAERLYSQAADLIKDLDGKTVFDLFCGTGTITQILARRAGKAVGVEIVPEAVEAAGKNAALNGLDNCRFICGDVFEVLESLDEKPDVICVDPPRGGIRPNALDKIISYGVDEILYISCNPKSLADNLFYLQYYGYEAAYIKPFDNFPWTSHIECATLITKDRKRR